MGTERNLQQIGVEAFAKPQVPTSAALTDVSAEILAASENRAYAVVELTVVSAGQVDVARGQTALADKGMSLQLNVPQKFFGAEALNGICATGAATATVIVQDFLHGQAPTVDYA